MASDGRGPAKNVLVDVWLISTLASSLVEASLTDSPMSADEFAVYGLIVDLGPLTAADLARATGLPPTTLSGVLARCERRGEIERVANPADRRSALLRLTARGVEVYRACVPALLDLLARLDAATPGGSDSDPPGTADPRRRPARRERHRRAAVPASAAARTVHTRLSGSAAHPGTTAARRAGSCRGCGTATGRSRQPPRPQRSRPTEPDDPPAGRASGRRGWCTAPGRRRRSPPCEPSTRMRGGPPAPAPGPAPRPVARRPPSTSTASAARRRPAPSSPSKAGAANASPARSVERLAAQRVELGDRPGHQHVVDEGQLAAEGQRPGPARVGDLVRGPAVLRRPGPHEGAAGVAQHLRRVEARAAVERPAGDRREPRPVRADRQVADEVAHAVEVSWRRRRGSTARRSAPSGRRSGPGWGTPRRWPARPRRRPGRRW